jgi:hypothetical protein
MEIEKLEDQIQVIKAEMEQYTEGGQALETTRLSMQRQTNDRLSAAETQAALYDRRCARADGGALALRALGLQRALHLLAFSLAQALPGKSPTVVLCVMGKLPCGQV